MHKNALLDFFYRTEDYFFRALSVSSVDLFDGITVYKTGVDFAGLNFLSIRSNPGLINVNQAIGASEQFFGFDNTPFCVCVPDKLASGKVGEALQKLGYVQTGATTLMGMELTETVELDAATVPMDANLHEWIKPLVDAFQIEPHVASQYIAIHQNALQKRSGMQHFTQMEGAQVVSSFTLTVHDNWARIDDMGTVAQFQRKGYATRLLKHALAVAKSMGVQYCFLSSSDMALPLYTRLGFQTLARQCGYALR